MRAKFKVTHVDRYEGQETLTLTAVCADQFGPEGESEDNDFARWTPYGELKMSVNNPNLLGIYNPGDKVYLNFTKVTE
jgi:hypothetical protein